MKKYIGTKEVMAEPMLKSVAVANGWARTSNDKVDLPGYHVQYNNPDGTTYDSWSPKDVFEKSYKCAETYVNRLYIELEDVESRHKKLAAFLESEYFKRIKQEGTKFLLTLQSMVMTQYSCILSQRINDKFVGDLPGMPFGIAIEALKFGLPVRRKGWNGNGMFVVKQVSCNVEGDVIPKIQSLPQPVKNLLMKRKQPCINYTYQLLLVQKSGRADSWTASSSDIFADDWEIVMEE